MSAQDQTQQQQPAQAQSTSTTTSTGTNTTSTATSTETPAQQTVVADDSLLCQWDKCSERCPTPESLFVSSASSSHLTRRPNPLQYCIVTDLHPFSGPYLRETCWKKEHKQLEPHLRVELMPYHHRQARSHHIPHSSTCSTQTAQMRLLR